MSICQDGSVGDVLATSLEEKASKTAEWPRPDVLHPDQSDELDFNAISIP